MSTNNQRLASTSIYRETFVRPYQGVAWPDNGRVVEVREDGDAGGAVRADSGLRTDECLHAVERGGRLPSHQVAAHQRLELHQRLERPQRLLRLQGFVFRFIR